MPKHHFIIMQFPNTLKSAVVKPLDQHIMKNYRPVSNLAFLSKVIEKSNC